MPTNHAERVRAIAQALHSTNTLRARELLSIAAAMDFDAKQPDPKKLVEICAFHFSEGNYGWPEARTIDAILQHWRAGLAPVADVLDPGSTSPHGRLPDWWPNYVRQLAELEDRNSPDGEPNAYVATVQEMVACALAAIRGEDA